METMDMTEERKPPRRRLLPEGWRKFKIVNCSNEELSKKGNKQYIVRIRDHETGYEEDLYAVAEPKKRWFLKELLDACSVPCESGVYTFEKPLPELLIGYDIMGLVQHEPNEYINRDNVKVTTTQHRIVEVSAVENTNEEVEWDEKFK